MQYKVKDGVLWKYEKESDKLRMGGGSWTIKTEWAEEPMIHTIVFESDKAIYTIKRLYALEKGWNMNFQGEEKLVVQEKHWDKKLKPNGRV